VEAGLISGATACNKHIIVIAINMGACFPEKLSHQIRIAHRKGVYK
jgi:hypothetical protein